MKIKPNKSKNCKVGILQKSIHGIQRPPPFWLQKNGHSIPQVKNEKTNKEKIIKEKTNKEKVKNNNNNNIKDNKNKDNKIYYKRY